MARKSACDEVARDSSDVSDVAVVWHVGPEFFEDLAVIRIYFTESDGFKSRVRGCDCEAADSRKQVQVFKTGRITSRRSQ